MRAAFTRSLPRCLLCALVAVCLLLPLAAFSGQLVLVYYAGFDEAASSSGNQEVYQALGGDAVLEGPPAVFDVEFDAHGNGAAVAHGNPTPHPASLDCRLEPSFSGDLATISMDLTRAIEPGDLVFRVADDNDIGVIDIVFDDDGDVVVVVGAAVVPVGLGPSLLGAPLDITLDLRNHDLGPSTWSLTVSGGGQHHKANGDLDTVGPIRVSSMRFIRPAGELSSDDVIDNVTLTTVYDVDTTQQGNIRQ